MRVRPRSLWIAWCVFLLSPAAAHADGPPPQALSAAELLALADSLGTQQRHHEAESLYRLALNDREETVRTEARFRLAMLLQRTGREYEAAIQLRRIVDEHPQAQRARLELAALLVRLGDEAGARRELRAVQTRPLPPDVARGVARFEEALRLVKPFSGSVSVGLAPDSNVNRATRSATLGTVIGDFTIDPEGKARSGMGLAVSGSGTLRWPVSTDSAMVAKASFSGRFYRDHQFNDSSAGLSIGPSVRFGQTRADFAINTFRQWYGGETLADTVSTSANLLRPLGVTQQLRLGASVGRINHRGRAEDGRIFGASAGFDKAFDAATGGGLTFAGARRTAVEPAYAYRSAQLSVFAWREIARMTMAGAVTGGRLVADARMPLFVEKRRDMSLRANLGVTVRRLVLMGFSPAVDVSYETNASTVAIYAYKRWSGEIALRRAF